MNSISQIELKPSLAVINGTIKTTSLKVAEHFGKQHKNVLQSISRLECSQNFTGLNFKLSEYIDESGKSNPYYEITKDGFVFLAMGFTGKKAAQWKEAYINAFNDMADKLNEKENSGPYITEFEAYKFNKSVKAHCKSDRKAYSYVYGGLYEYYGITTYKHIPAGCLKEAAEIICGIKLINTGAEPTPVQKNLTIADAVRIMFEIIDAKGEETLAELRKIIRAEERAKIDGEIKKIRETARHDALIDLFKRMKERTLSCEVLVSIKDNQINEIIPVAY